MHIECLLHPASIFFRISHDCEDHPWTGRARTAQERAAARGYLNHQLRLLHISRADVRPNVFPLGPALRNQHRSGHRLNLFRGQHRFDWLAPSLELLPWIVGMSTRVIEALEQKECARPGTWLMRIPSVPRRIFWHGRRASCRSEQRAKPSGTRGLRRGCPCEVFRRL